MNKTWLICILSIFLLGTASCSKDDDEDDKVGKEDIIGTWVATSGKYNLSLEITSSGYDFRISEPGKGGSYDIGTYDISDTGKITFVNNSNTVLAIGQVQNERLSLTFVSMVAIIWLGTEAASNIVFTLSEENNGSGGDESSGFLVIQNLSEKNNIVKFDFYDTSGNLLDSDSDVLEPDYQFTYEVATGSYLVKVTDNKGKTYTSKSFKIVKDKSTVLAYNGSALNILATGIDNSELSRAVHNNMAFKYIHTGFLQKNMENK